MNTITNYLEFSYLILTFISISYLIFRVLLKRSDWNTISLVGISIILTNLIIQTFSIYILTFIPKLFNPVILNSFILTLLLWYFSRIKFQLSKVFSIRRLLVFHRKQFLVLGVVVVATIIYSCVTLVRSGDMGWDSNAYHLPLAGILLYYGASDWPTAISDSLFTIFSPYGPHALAANWIWINDDFRMFSTASILQLVGLICVVLGDFYKRHPNNFRFLMAGFLLVISVVVSPSVIGQITHGYVDLIIAVYVFVGFYILFADSGLSDNIKIFLSVIFVSSAAAGKTQYITIGFLVLLIVVLLVLIKRIPLKVIPIAFILFTVVCIVPYLRNYLEYGNPVFPISFGWFKGSISISELNSSIDSFAPSAWPSSSLLRIIFSILLSSMFVFRDIVSMQLGKYIENRPDISAFAYDTVIGGYGLPLAIIAVLSLFLVLFNLFVSRRDFLQNQIFRILILFTALFGLLIISGGWWARYGLGLGLFLILAPILNYNFLGKDKGVIWFLIPVLLFANLYQGFGIYKFNGYERFQAFSNSKSFDPRFGLIQDIPSDLKSGCRNITIVEPRATFTSFAWVLNCDNYENIGSKTFVERLKSQPEANFLLSEATYDMLKSNSFRDFEIHPVRAWFDPNGDFGSVILIPKSKTDV